MHILVLGAGPTGLVTAMLVAADGHRVTVVDQDAEAPAGGGQQVWEDWKRPGVGQFRAAHLLAPIGYRVLRRELPTAVSEIVGWGGHLHNMIGGALSLLPDGVPEPADERFDTIAARRPVFEAALLAAAEKTEGIAFRRRATVTELLYGEPGDNKHVTGVRLEDGEQVASDLVVAASGRAGGTWMPAARVSPAGATPGFRYYTRHFRAPDRRMPGPFPWPLHHYESLSVSVLPGDSGTWSMTLITSGADQELRGLGREDAWQRTAFLCPDLAPWAQGEPLGGVVAMGGIRSSRRSLVVSGRPVVTGLITVGDAWGTTNPAFGLGMSLGFLHASLLRAVLRTVGTGRPADLALRFHAATERTLTPVWAGLASWETHRQAEIAARIRGADHHSDDPAWYHHLRTRSLCQRDPDVMRAMADVGFLLADASKAMGRPAVVARLARSAMAAPDPIGGPDRRQLRAAVGASA